MSQPNGNLGREPRLWGIEKAIRRHLGRTENGEATVWELADGTGNSHQILRGEDGAIKRHLERDDQWFEPVEDADSEMLRLTAAGQEANRNDPYGPDPDPDPDPNHTLNAGETLATDGGKKQNNDRGELRSDPIRRDVGVLEEDTDVE